jgi:hypothetical protein
MSLLRTSTSDISCYLPIVALLSALLLGFIAMVNPPAIRITNVMYPDVRPQPHLPFSASSFSGNDDGVFMFVAEVAVHHSVFSSGILGVSADDCLDVITVNDTVVENRREQPESWRCRRDLQQRFDLSEHLRKGANKVLFTVGNSGGRHGIAITPLFSPMAILAMTVYMAMLTYSLTLLAAEHVPIIRSMLSHPAGRMARVGFLPAFGTMLLAWLSANNAGPGWLADHLTATLITALIPTVLAISAFDRSEPLAAIRNYWCATASVACFLWSFHLLSAVQWSNPEIRWWAVAGLVIGLGATVPIKEILLRFKRSPRILAVIAVAVAAPHFYWHFNLAMWESVGIYTGKAVQGLLWLVGIVTNTNRSHPGHQ